LKHREKAWKKKLKAIEIECNSKKLKDEVEKLKKKDLPAAFLGLLGPGYIYTQISLRHFLKVKAESLEQKQISGQLDSKIRDLWKLFYISAVLWLSGAVVLINIISKVLLKR
jgi:hypothetical protein